MRGVLPRGTQAAWQEVVELRPAPAYLVGATAIAAHLHHRLSKDLDFFLSEPVDMDSLYDRLQATGHFVASQMAAGKINGVLSEARVQFLLADTQRNTEALTIVDGIPIAGLGDLLATKLKVVMDTRNPPRPRKFLLAGQVIHQTGRKDSRRGTEFLGVSGWTFGLVARRIGRPTPKYINHAGLAERR
jgi:hypothetical protein